MDKSKIIDYVISEWAMRSHDGLASGYSNISNINILRDILVENKVSIEEVDEVLESLFGEAKRKSEDYEYLFKVTDPTDSKKVLNLISIGHPEPDKYPDYPESREYTGPHELEPSKYRVANDENINNALAASEKDEIFANLRNVKKVSLANVRKLKEILSEFDDKSAVNKFRELYNSVGSGDGMDGIDTVLNIYRGRLYPELQPLINKIDSNRFAGAGRGETPMVFMLKGASSGGNRKMDIIFAEMEDKNSGVEVKELSSGTIAISAPTLDNFSTSKFNVAIHELALLASKQKDTQAFLTKVLNDPGIQDGGIYPYIAKGSTHEKHEKSIDAFFEDPKVGEVSQFLLEALFIISEKILRRKEMGDKVGEKAIGSVEIDIGNKHREFKVPDEKVPELSAAVDAAQGEKTTLEVPITPKDEKSDEVIAEKAMKLSFFREKWDQKRIQDEIMSLILKKYKKMIIVDKRKKQNNAYFYDEAKMATLEFVALGFGKIFMYVPGMGTSKASAVKDIQQTA